jgi:hypothetical protein
MGSFTRIGLLLGIAHGLFLLAYGQDTTSSPIRVEFTVPKDWKRVNDSLFVIKDYQKQLTYWSSALEAGHMPWRNDPRNVAVTCLWDFGIKDGTPVFEFAKQLVEVRKNRIYYLTAGAMSYVIYIRIEKRTPIACKLEIKHRRKSGG